MKLDHQEVRLDKVIRLCTPLLGENTKVLDIGCHDGYLLDILSGICPLGSYCGCDIDPITTRNNIKQCDIRDGLPYKSDSFDLITICEVIEHVRDDSIVFKEITRCLKPDGHLIVTTPNVTSLQKRIQFFFGIVPGDLKHTKHISFNNFKTLNKKLNGLGFVVEKQMTNNIPCRLDLGVITHIAVWFGDYFYSMGNQIIIKSKLTKCQHTSK